MSSSWSCYIVIVFFLTSITAQGIGELVVLRSPTSADSSTWNFTCIADDDDSALIWDWYHDGPVQITNLTIVKPFQPKRPSTKSHPLCAVWKAELCIADNWNLTSSWEFVNSADEPMGPVFDYRWEDFTEFVFGRKDEKYRYVAKVHEPFTSIIFSARGEDINILLCETEDLTQSMCFRIIIQDWFDSTQVWTYENGAAETRTPTQHSGRRQVGEFQSLNGILDGSEWQTFRIEWASEEKIIKIFKNSDAEPFFEGISSRKLPGSHVFVRSGKLSGVRFHFYQYLLTGNDNEELLTAEIDHYDEEFCVRLLVGMCPTCQMKIDLLDHDERPIGSANIISSKSDARTDLLSWQPIKLIRHLEGPFPKRVHLRIRTLLNGIGSGKQWAVDKFHICKPLGEKRESIAILKGRLGIFSSSSHLNCQRLSYSHSALVKPFSHETIQYDTSGLQKITDILERSCHSSCPSLGAGSSICTSMGCSCNRGFLGGDCIRQCFDGSYGYGCNMRCGSCLEGYCDKRSGHCPRSMCENEKLLPPLCKQGLKFAPPKVTKLEVYEADSSSNTVSLRWKSPQSASGEIESYHVLIYSEPDKVFSESSVKVLHGVPMCKLQWRDYVCLENCHLPSNATTNIILRVYAKSKEVPEGGPPLDLIHSLKFFYNQAPGDLEDFRITHHGQGLVNLTWLHPSFSSTKIKQFRILVNRSLTYLLQEPVTGYPITVNYTVTQKHEYYSMMLALEPSSTYHLSIVAVNGGNISSRRSKRTIFSIPSSFGFVSETRPRVTINDTLIEIKIPKIINATQNTAVKIIVKGPVLCTPNQPHESSPPANPVGSDNETEWDVAMYLVKNAPTEPLKITTEQYQVIKSKCNLDLTKNYTIIFVVREMDSGESVELTELLVHHGVTNTSTDTKLTMDMNLTTDSNLSIDSSSSTNTNLTWLIVFPIMAVSILTIFICYRNRRKSSRLHSNFVSNSVSYKSNPKRLKELGYVEPIPYWSATSGTNKLTTFQTPELSVPRSEAPESSTKYQNTITPKQKIELSPSAKPHANFSSDLGTGKNSIAQPESREYRLPENLYAMPKEHDSCRVSIGYFEEYTKQAAVSGLLYSQFKLLPQGLTRPCEYGGLPKNMPKNRDRSQIAYGAASQYKNEKNFINITHYFEPLGCQAEWHFFGYITWQRAMRWGAYLVPAAEHTAEEAILQNRFDEALMKSIISIPRSITTSSSLQSYERITKEPQSLNCTNLLQWNQNVDCSTDDHSRVLLEKISGDPYSDYINASYIQGYRKERAYIATQGPMPNTVNDFWRMVWQEEVRVICMLTNVVESAEIKCAKYWPDVGTSANYGKYLVSTTDHQVLADYTFRTFELSHQKEMREVRHLHYTEWPSLGVPIHPQSIVSYMKQLEKTPAGNGPVIVHCSTGDGRTGTIILSDICLRRVVEENEINVTAVIAQLRDSRANMVCTLQQYILAHIIISECIVALPTQIPCMEVLSTLIPQMRLRLPSDMQRLMDTTWQEEALNSSATSRSSTAGDGTNNKHQELNSVGAGVADSDLFESTSSQVNAVRVDSVRVKKQYLASCLPSFFNIPNFWEFITERDIKLMIILQCSDPRNPSCCDIMPDESLILAVPHMRVENKTSFNEGGYFTREKLLLTDTSKSITVLTCKGWGRGQNGEPPAPATLVSLWVASEKILRKEGQTLVLCHDGISGCGLYLALSFLLERMAVERECDVISAVRAVRRSRPEFVQSLEEFEYLYDAAVNYAQCFETYANFS